MQISKLKLQGNQKDFDPNRPLDEQAQNLLYDQQWQLPMTNKRLRLSKLLLLAATHLN